MAEVKLCPTCKGRKKISLSTVKPGTSPKLITCSACKGTGRDMTKK